MYHITIFGNFTVGLQVRLQGREMLQLTVQSTTNSDESSSRYHLLKPQSLNNSP